MLGNLGDDIRRRVQGIGPLRRVPFTGLNPFGEIRIAKRRLPHFTQAGVTYFVTFRLADSIPSDLLLRWRHERDIWLRWHPEPWTEKVAEESRERFTKPMEGWLDAGIGACHLRRPAVRRILQRCLRFADGQRHDLDSYVIMPNHVHLIIVPRRGESLSALLKAVKGISARECNRELGTVGMPFWMDESYDRIVRDASELCAYRDYIARNPIKAGLRPDEYTLVMNDVIDIRDPQ